MSYSEFEARIRKIAVLPIVLPKSVSFCIDVIGALAEGGATGIEIVLRSKDALPAIEAGRKTFPAMVFGAGTVLTPAQYDAAVAAGADFAISPGFAPELVAYAASRPVPLIPGVQTATEVIAARSAGAALLKFYPSEPAGGTAVLSDYGNVFPDVSFMPSGKIDLHLLPGYSALRNVASVGGTWMYTKAGELLPRERISSVMKQSLQAMERGE
ncbi:bifunctional 4-hydroxy-2-oxoglutarate aldolase/2-dehydro-3-deoxy-phosphogluconate aldolase [Chelativorans sp.]|uniref:bifunctional 4-hydroxy-2-oxoglutarate aldolase/2-dehydro-3-deoxy-phosphogluconate aldolase n=1 Tax=Chelativorans sp. TaxID=2203393 RepID=UPI002811986B|nr:bifunctional 4-hydroxy-2-oxoglutarate aldolase/2-dehydro-3-deoxy-phosphogluconate aldolase [Chelativorans sp.]